MVDRDELAVTAQAGRVTLELADAGYDVALYRSAEAAGWELSVVNVAGPCLLRVNRSTWCYLDGAVWRHSLFEAGADPRQVAVEIVRVLRCRTVWPV